MRIKGGYIYMTIHTLEVSSILTNETFYKIQN